MSDDKRPSGPRERDDVALEAYIRYEETSLGRTAIIWPSLRSALDDGKLIANKKVLDVGCGTGLLTKELIGWGAHFVMGIDRNAAYVEYAKVKYDKKFYGFLSDERDVQFTNFEAHAMRRMFMTFNVAVAVNVLQFADSLAALFQMVQGVYEHLEDGGLFVGVVPNGSTDYKPRIEDGQKFGSYVEVPEQPKLDDLLPLKVHYFSRNDEVGSQTMYFYFRHTFEECFTAAGFSKVEFFEATASEEACKQLDERFFEPYAQHPTDLVFKAYK